MTSKAMWQRSQLSFMALEGLSMTAAVLGFLLGMRPLLWVSGLLSSAALRFLWRAAQGKARASGRRNPVPLAVVVLPALVMFGVSFFLL